MNKILHILISRSSLFISLLILLIFCTQSINDWLKYPEIYNGHVFLLDISFFEYLKMLTAFIFSISFLIYINKKYCIENYIDNIKINYICFLIFISSFIFKILLHGFNFTDPIAQDGVIQSVFIDGLYNSYKLYAYMALPLYKLSEHYEIYLGLLNIFLGSLIPVFVYLISRKIKQGHLISLFISALVLLFMPLNAIETVYRIDLTYIFLFILSIYLTLITTHYKSRSFILLIIVLTLSCFAREQTLYMLPLYVFYFLFIDIKNKFILISLLLTSVTITSLSISKYNDITYGSSSFYRDGHLIIKLLQYGYLSDHFSSHLRENLDNAEMRLYNDIKSSYENHVLPHKREKFKNNDLPEVWSFIRPDSENIFYKNHRSRTNGKLDHVRAELIKAIDKYPARSKQTIELSELNNIVKDVYHRLSIDDKPMALDLEFIINKDILLGKTHLRNLKNNKKYCNTTERISDSCLKYFLNNITERYLYERSDLWYLKKAGLYDFALKYDPNTKRYIQLENIHLSKWIILEIPLLYVTQSLLTLTSMTGYFPDRVHLGNFARTQEESIVSKFIIIKIQKIYYFMINLWYIICFLSIVYFLTSSKRKIENIDMIFICSIPLYYGLFLSISTFSEFSRLMLPIVPFIFMSLIIFLSRLIDSFYNTTQ